MVNLKDIKNPIPVLYLIPIINNIRCYLNQRKKYGCRFLTAASWNVL
jgi:hypothetical protein